MSKELTKTIDQQQEIRLLKMMINVQNETMSANIKAEKELFALLDKMITTRNREKNAKIQQDVMEWMAKNGWCFSCSMRRIECGHD